jgi:hypothetical protein
MRARKRRIGRSELRRNTRTVDLTRGGRLHGGTRQAGDPRAAEGARPASRENAIKAARTTA